MRVVVAVLIIVAVVLLLSALMPSRPSLIAPLTVDPLRVSSGLI